MISLLIDIVIPMRVNLAGIFQKIVIVKSERIVGKIDQQYQESMQKTKIWCTRE